MTGSTWSSPATKVNAAKPTAAGFRINFPFNSAVLPDSAHEMIDVVAQVMKESPEIKVRVEGHTDAVGSADYNVSLSARRAVSMNAARPRSALRTRSTTPLVTPELSTLEVSRRPSGECARQSAPRSERDGESGRAPARLHATTSLYPSKRRWHRSAPRYPRRRRPAPTDHVRVPPKHISLD